MSHTLVRLLDSIAVFVISSLLCSSRILQAFFEQQSHSLEASSQSMADWYNTYWCQAEPHTDTVTVSAPT